MSVSVLTLTAISVERYLAICKPWRERLTTRQILTCILLIWVTSLSVAVPDLVFYEVHSTFDESVTTYLRYCRRVWSEMDNMAYHMFMLLVLYSMPICLMAYTYTVISRQLWKKDNIPGSAESGIQFSWKRKRSDSVLWQKPIHQQKNPKSKFTTQKRHENVDYKTIADRLRTVS